MKNKKNGYQYNPLFESECDREFEKLKNCPFLLRDVVNALWDNDVENMKKYIALYNCPFALLKIIINQGRKNTEMWNYLLSLLDAKHMTEPFIYNDEEHTLLTLLCSIGCSTLEKKIKDLVKRGANVNQLVGERKKTALSYLVRHDMNFDTLKCCINLGADPTLGHLLVNSSRFFTEDQYNQWHSFQFDKYSILTTIGPDSDWEMYYNLSIVRFLVHEIGLDCDDVEPITGATPLLAACSESMFTGGNGNDKLSILLEKEPNLYAKTNEGIGIWQYAERQDKNQMFGNDNDLYTCLLEAQYNERVIWEERLRVCQETRLNDFPLPLEQVLLPFFTAI